MKVIAFALGACYLFSVVRSRSLIPGPSGNVLAYPSLPPKFEPRWRMNESTIFMPCNTGLKNGGFFNASASAAWGVADFDYSNARAIWSKNKPMDCQEHLVTQAAMTKRENARTFVWVYRNIVTAMPWFKDVRKKINDPAYSGWFMSFKPGYQQNGTTLYHDWKSNAKYGQAAGADCGGIPCAEYLFDHRNDSARAFIVDTFIGGPDAMGSPHIDGIFLDDFWSNFPYTLPWSKGDCATSPTGGPSETLGGCIELMGLKAEDVEEMAEAWEKTLLAVLHKIVDMGGYSFQMLQLPDFGEGNADAPPIRSTPRNASFFHRECSPNSVSQKYPILLSLTGADDHMLPMLEQDIAAFLLIRSEYAWLGYGWKGCGDDNFWIDPHHRKLLVSDYGMPLDQLCFESAPGVFTRRWSKATVSLDTNTNKPYILFKKL